MPNAVPRWLWLALAVCFAGHVYLGFALGLSTDEAHYALYARHPALSYFDHPPLVGWVQIPFVWMGGTDWMMRIVPLALWGITAWALWRFSVWALILFLLSPVHQLLGLALVPDSLVFPLTLWVMVLTWKLSSDSACTQYWLWLGVALGLTGLSKYTGIFLAIGAALVLFASHGVALLKIRSLWLSVLIALVLISPVFIWNIQNEWLSFAYQLTHANGGENAWEAKRVLTYTLVQWLAYGSLPLLGLIVFCVKLRHKQARLMWFCFAFGLPLLILMLYLSGKGAALPHWTAGAWIALLPLCALGFHHALKTAPTFVAGLGVLQVLTLLALGLAMGTGGQWQGKPVIRGAMNPFADLHDWSAATVQGLQLQTTYKADALAVGNWSLASRLAWYGQKMDPTVRVMSLDGKNKQFEIWYGRATKDQSLIWVDWSEMRQKVPAQCKPIEGALASYAGRASRFDFYFCPSQP